jgi:hypothetical protein
MGRWLFLGISLGGFAVNVSLFLNIADVCISISAQYSHIKMRFMYQ